MTKVNPKLKIQKTEVFEFGSLDFLGDLSFGFGIYIFPTNLKRTTAGRSRTHTTHLLNYISALFYHLITNNPHT